MRAVVAVEGRIARTPDGAMWTEIGQDHQFWTRYLSAFDEVRVVARVRDVAAAPPGSNRVDGPQVRVWPVPHYLGPYQYLARRAAIGRALRDCVGPTDALILRAPTPVGSLLAAARDRQRLPYAVEVVGDPYDVFAPGVVDHPLRPVLRRIWVRQLRRQCRRAIAVAYATERFLQARYPAAPGATSVAVSDIDLGPAAFVDTPRVAVRRAGPTTLISVGSLEQRYKGVDTLITALATLVADGRDLRLVHVGGGRYRPWLVDLAHQHGVAERVEFTGALPPGEAVRRRLDAADLFVMPSRTEGLPRALIEAMARALPAVGSTVGGIPELLPPELTVAPDDPHRLAATVAALLDRPELMAAASARNLARARDYAATVLRTRRADFYRAVADMTVDRCRRHVDTRQRSYV